MIFPDWGTAPNEESQSLPLFREWAVDWQKGVLALRDGEPYTVTGTEALKTWVRLALAPECRRFACSAHSHDYGNELETLMGRCADSGIRDSQLRRMVRDALLANPYITGVDGFSVTQTGDTVRVACTVRTVYDSFETEVSL